MHMGAGNAAAAPDDLSPDEQDRREGIEDWRKCLVNGRHLQRSASRGGSEPAMEAEGAKGEVFRAVWKKITPVTPSRTSEHVHPELCALCVCADTG